MIGRLDKVVTDALRGLRIFAHDGRIAADIAQWQQRTQLHCSAPYTGLASITLTEPRVGMTAVISNPAAFSRS